MLKNKRQTIYIFNEHLGPIAMRIEFKHLFSYHYYELKDKTSLMFTRIRIGFIIIIAVFTRTTLAFTGTM